MEKAGISIPVLVWTIVFVLNFFLVFVVVALLRMSASKAQHRIIAWSYSLFWSLCCGVCFWLGWNHSPRDYFVTTSSVLAFLALLFVIVLCLPIWPELTRTKRRNF